MLYSKEQLEVWVASSLSVADIMRKAGYKCLNGGTHSHITRQLKKFEIDTSHFLGQGKNRGAGHKGGFKKRHWSEILILNRLSGRKEYSKRLRLAMVESGIPTICATCGLGSLWKEKPLVLQISHKDGNSLNNIKENLHFQCPNCHSQTEDYGGKGTGKTRQLTKSADVSGLDPEA